MLNWKPYDQHDWSKCNQRRLDNPAKRRMERLIAKALWIPVIETLDVWGTVCPPGRNALVVHVHPGMRHRLDFMAREVGLKIYNHVDGRVMWPSILRYHRDQRHLLPRLPEDHVQEVLDWGTVADEKGAEHHYLVQRWVQGEVLEQKIIAGLQSEETLSIVDDLFRNLLIPLWSKGVCWWDVRASNYVVTPEGKLVMIDTDTLGGYATEMLETPQVFEKRNHGSLTAMRRYGRLLADLACRRAARGTKAGLNSKVRRLVETHLKPVFCEPYPLAASWKETAMRAYAMFRAGYKPLLPSLRSLDYAEKSPVYGQKRRLNQPTTPTGLHFIRTTATNQLRKCSLKSRD